MSIQHNKQLFYDHAYYDYMNLLSVLLHPTLLRLRQISYEIQIRPTFKATLPNPTSGHDVIAKRTLAMRIGAYRPTTLFMIMGGDLGGTGGTAPKI